MPWVLGLKPEPMLLKIGTRGSKLALAQSEWVKEQIEASNPGLRVELVRIKTKGDKLLDSPLSKIGGKGLFVKEIEDALLNHFVDLAVHSMKDVPAELPDGLQLAVYPEREDPRDAFVSQYYDRFENLPQGAVVGTSSLRRSAQLRHARPDLQIVSLRGNVDTRLRKLASGEMQAIVLAKAGLARLGLLDRVTHTFSLGQMLPAIGQGALGLEIREDDAATYGSIRFMDHEPTRVAAKAERAFLRELEGGCQVPIAAHAVAADKELVLEGMVAELDGSRVIRDKLRGHRDAPEEAGIELARRLLGSGAKEILDRIYRKGAIDT